MVRILHSAKNELEDEREIRAPRFLVHGTHVQVDGPLFVVSLVLGVDGIHVDHRQRSVQDFRRGLADPDIPLVPASTVQEQTVNVNTT